jgi:cytokinin riboside 5'-monophosphate phosphoribohydrolase
MMEQKTICVFCGSQEGHDPADVAAARELGAKMAARGFRLVYGGGSIGLMGALARSVLQAGGEVVGIIPQALLDREVGLVEATELIVTMDLRQRKSLMDERADAFVVLPGGFGTLEEFMEVVTLRQLGYHDRPIILLNLHGYYDPLLNFFAQAFEQGYIFNRHNHLYYEVSSVDETFALLDSLRPL